MRGKEVSFKFSEIGHFSPRCVDACGNLLLHVVVELSKPRDIPKR